LLTCIIVVKEIKPFVATLQQEIFVAKARKSETGIFL